MRLLLRIGGLSAFLVFSATFVLLAHAVAVQRPEPAGKTKVFIFAGQSNMEGRADGDKLSEDARKRLDSVRHRIQFAYNYEPIRPLDAVTPSEEIRDIYRTERMFGPELFFGIALAEAWPDETFLFIKRTEGNTSLHGCWNPDWSEEKAARMGEASGPKLYDESMAYIRSVLDGYASDEYEICAMLWVQGESDGKVPEAATTYGVTLQRLIERARLDLGQEDLPFILFEVGSSQVVAGMEQCAATVPNTVLLPQEQDHDSPDFYAKMENGHYNHEGMKKLGTRFASVYLESCARKTD